MQNFEQTKCYEQLGSTDCGLFAIAYAVDVSNGNNVYDLINNQSQDERTFMCCFEQRKITSFPLYEKTNTEKVVTIKETSSPWNKSDLQVDWNKKGHKTLQKRLRLQIVLKPKELKYRKKIQIKV